MDSKLRHVKWSDPELNRPPSVNRPYRHVIGSVILLMIGTRPDITFSVWCLSQLSGLPLEPHWTTIKLVLRYI